MGEERGQRKKNEMGTFEKIEEVRSRGKIGRLRSFSLRGVRIIVFFQRAKTSHLVWQTAGCHFLTVSIAVSQSFMRYSCIFLIARYNP